MCLDDPCLLYLLLHELLQDDGEHFHSVDRLFLEANARSLYNFLIYNLVVFHVPERPFMHLIVCC
jgi:hypothetical protein